MLAHEKIRELLNERLKASIEAGNDDESADGDKQKSSAPPSDAE